jgi:uroporphyrinogen decarboxylase
MEKYHDSDLAIYAGMRPFGMFNTFYSMPMMDLKVAKKKWGDRICLWGNIDLVQTLPYGTVEEVEAEVRQRIQDAGPGGGYICATANSVTGWCKIENIFAMTAAVKKYGTYQLVVD